MRESEAYRDELVRIRAGFQSARLAGLWRSPYPQHEYSALLGCDVREQTADPTLPLDLYPPRPMSVHAVGYAVSSSASVWRR